MPTQYTSKNQAKTSENQEQQAQQAATYALAKTGISLPAHLEDRLAAVFPDDKVRQQIVVMSLVVGVKPEWLDAPQTIGVLKQAWDLIKRFGAQPMQDFYIVNYGKYNGPAEPALVRSLNWLDGNARRSAFMNGLEVFVRCFPIIGMEKTNELIEWLRPSALLDKRNRVARSRYEVKGQKYDEDEWSYGFALPGGFKVEKDNGQSYIIYPDARLLTSNNPQNTLMDAALRRAQRAAARLAGGREDQERGDDSPAARIAAAMALSANHLLGMFDSGKLRVDNDGMPRLGEIVDARDLPENDEVVDGEFTETAQEEKKPEVITVRTEKKEEKKEEATGEGPNWKELYGECSPATVNVIMDVRDAGDSGPTTENGLKMLRTFVSSAASWGLNDQLPSGENKIDVLLAAISGKPVGDVIEVIPSKMGNALHQKCTKEEDGKRVYDASSAGAKAIGELAGLIQRYDSEQF